MEVRRLVRALGGPVAVGAVAGVSANAVCNWSKREQVPTRHHATLWKLARAKGVAWTPPGMADLLPPPAPDPPEPQGDNDPGERTRAA